MANRYPPTPSFGGAFPTFPYAPSPTQHNPNAPMPAFYAARPPVTSNSPLSAPQASGAANPQFLNASTFESNSQIASPGLYLAPFHPHNLPPDLLKQLANSGLPPPPPPTSFLPGLGVPPFQPRPSVPNNFTPLQNHFPNAVANTVNNGRIALSLPQTQPPYTLVPEAITSSREEGELSDGELEDVSAADTSQTVSQDGTTKMQMSPHNKTLPTREAQPRSTSDQRPGLGNVVQRQRHNDPETFSSGREGSGSSYDPPSVATPDVQMNLADATSGAITQSHNHNHPQLRELAKGALLSLAPHNIRFSDIVKEGVDPDLLQQLYEELGLKDTRIEVLTNTDLKQTGLRRALSIDREPNLPAAKDSQEAKEILLGTQTRVSKLSVPAPTGPHLPEPESWVSSSAKSAQPSQQTAVDLEASRTSTVVATTPNVAMERKDRIAQLLAAKTGKQAAVKGIQEHQTPPFQASPSPSIAVDTSVPALPPAECVTPTPSIHQTSKLVKNKAQTEKVRQKMESLRKEAEAEARARARTEFEAQLPRKPEVHAYDTTAMAHDEKTESSLLSHTPQHISGNLGSPVTHSRSEQPRTTPASEQTSRSNYAYRIPGLFMTSEEAADVADRQDSAARVETLDLYHDLDNTEQSENKTPVIPATQDLPTSDSESLTESNLAALTSETFAARVSHKRPLASDLFDESTPPAKRPFGRKDSNDRIVIDVDSGESENSSEDIRMDIEEDSQASVPPSAKGLVKHASEQEIQISLPATTDNEKGSATISSNGFKLSTPTQEADKEDLWRAKHVEIEVMRKKIAEMEERRKAKRGQSQVQSPQSSVPGTPAPATARPTIQAIPFQPRVSVLSPRSSSPNHPPSNTTLGQNTITIPRTSNMTASGLGTDKATSHVEDFFGKGVRRKALQDGLPSLDAEVRTTQLKLAQTRVRIAQIKRDAERREAEIRVARQREAEMMEEARRLEEQLEMGLSGRDQFSEELQSLEAAVNRTEEYPTAQGPTADKIEVLAEETRSVMSNDISQTAILDQMDETSFDVAEAVIDTGMSGASSGPLGKESSSATVRGDVDMALGNLDYAGAAEEVNTEMSDVQSTSHIGHESKAQPRLIADRVSLEHQFKSTESASTPLDLQAGNEEPRVNMADDMEDIEDENDGSVSMSDSSSDDYQPLEVFESVRASDMDSDGYEPDDAVIRKEDRSGHTSEVDDDYDYEPAEEVKPLKVDVLSTEQGLAKGHETVADQVPAPVLRRDLSQQLSAGLGNPATDDIANGLQLSEANTLTKSQQYLPAADSESTADALQEQPITETHFTPYSSPLSMMKSYRFNPRFTEVVAGGYRSLTYSNKIDPRLPLCPIEAAGGTCPDTDCREQHFRQMILPADDKILVEMSSATDFKQKDQRDQYLTGLKTVIAELRLKGVKEFEMVAAELASYRRRFLSQIDPDRATIS